MFKKINLLTSFFLFLFIVNNVNAAQTFINDQKFQPELIEKISVVVDWLAPDGKPKTFEQFVKLIKNNGRSAIAKNTHQYFSAVQWILNSPEAEEYYEQFIRPKIYTIVVRAVDDPLLKKIHLNIGGNRYTADIENAPQKTITYLPFGRIVQGKQVEIQLVEPIIKDKPILSPERVRETGGDWMKASDIARLENGQLPESMINKEYYKNKVDLIKAPFGFGPKKSGIAGAVEHYEDNRILPKFEEIQHLPHKTRSFLVAEDATFRRMKKHTMPIFDFEDIKSFVQYERSMKSKFSDIMSAEVREGNPENLKNAFVTGTLYLNVSTIPYANPKMYLDKIPEYEIDYEKTNNAPIMYWTIETTKRGRVMKKENSLNDVDSRKRLFLRPSVG